MVIDEVIGKMEENFVRVQKSNGGSALPSLKMSI